MTTTDASELLRTGLLEGVSVVLARAPGAAGGDGARHKETSPSLAGEVGLACAGLGARVLELVLDGGELDGRAQTELGETIGRLQAEVSADLKVLVIDGAGLFAHSLTSARSDAGCSSARSALRSCLDASWSATHAFVNHILLAHRRGGRIIYLTPSADAGEHADAALSGLENLARTLSIEWARHRITTVAVAPPSGLPSDVASQVAALAAYLASPAGAYFSGCLLDLRGVAAVRAPVL